VGVGISGQEGMQVRDLERERERERERDIGIDGGRVTEREWQNGSVRVRHKGSERDTKVQSGGVRQMESMRQKWVGGLRAI